MAMIADSHQGVGGPGILALQHHGYSHRYALDMRASIWAQRVTDREIGAGKYGHYVTENDTIGDIIGASFWPSVEGVVTGGPSGRPTGAWSWVWPSVVGVVEAGGTYTPPHGAIPPSARTPDEGPPVVPATTVSDLPPQSGRARWYPVQFQPGVSGPIGAFNVAVGPGAMGGAGAGGAAAAPGAPAAGGGGGIGGGGVQGKWTDPGIRLWNPPFPEWACGPEGNPAAFVLPESKLIPWWQYHHPEWFAGGSDLIVQGADFFGMGPMLFPFFVLGDGDTPGGFVPPKKKSPKNTAAWMSDHGDVDDREEGEVVTLDDVYPMRDESWDADTRFAPKNVDHPAGWPTFPKGFRGLVVPGTEEDRQVLQFHPSDPRIVCPHTRGDPRTGTIVEEPNRSGELDGSRQAHIQSLLRVVPDPQGVGKTGEDTISLNFGKNPNRDVSGGLMTDAIGHGHLGAIGGGPIIAGSGKCPHIIGRDRDGVTIRSAHIATRSLFIDDSGKRDAPLFFEGRYEDGDDLEFPVPVHLTYDPQEWHQWLGGDMDGMWKWFTTSHIERQPTTRRPEETPPPETPPETPPTPTPPTTDPEYTPPSSPVPTPVTPPPEANRMPPGVGRTEPTDPYTYNHSTSEQAVTGVLAKPQVFSLGAEFGSLSGRPTEAYLNAYRSTVPLTGRLEAYGAQGGVADADYLTQGRTADAWEYTQQPGGGSSPTGTANGGFVLLPPEVTLEHIDDDFAPQGIDVSETHLIMGPGARLGFGTPELAGGGVKDGASMEATGSGTGSDIRVERYDSNGDALDALELLKCAEIKHLSGVDFAAAALNDITDDDKQKQVGIRTDAGNEEIQLNIGGTVFGTALTAV